MDEREIPTIAGGMKSRRRLGDMLADDRRIANLLVTVPELVMREPDGFRIVRELGLTKRPAEQRDGPRLIAFRKGNTSMQAPERGEQRGRKHVARGIGGTAERGGGLRDFVGKQPSFGERATQGDLVLAFE